MTLTTTSPTWRPRVLIVDADTVFAHHLRDFLKSRAYRIMGITADCTTARQQIDRERPDLVLIDLASAGERSAIELGHYLHQWYPSLAVIYLAGLADKATIERAKATEPAGFLSKRLQWGNLLASLETIWQHHADRPRSTEWIIKSARSGKRRRLAAADILYLEADHVYVNLHLANGEVLLTRHPLRWWLEQLPTDRFVQIHRSFAVNLDRVRRWNGQQLIVGDRDIPISRSRRRRVAERLEGVSQGV